MVLLAAFALVVSSVGAFVLFQSTRNIQPVAGHLHIPESEQGMTLAEWTAAIEADPTNASLYFGRGHLHAARDERKNAIADYSKAISLTPDYAEAYAMRSYEYCMTHENGKALQDCNRVIALTPTNYGGYSARAFVEMVTEHYDNAIADCKKAIELLRSQYGEKVSRSYVANQYRSLSLIYLAIGRQQSALEMASKYTNLAADDEQSNALSFRGAALVNQQKFDQARQDLELAIAKPHCRGMAWAELAQCYIGLGRLSDAQASSQNAFQLASFPAHGYRLRAEVNRIAGLYEKAIEDYSTATSLEEDAPGHRQRAIAYINLGEFHSALADLERSYQLVPTSGKTLSYLAYVEDKLGQTQKAEEHIKQAFSFGSVHPIALVNRALIELNHGATEKPSKISIRLCLSTQT